MKNGKSEASFHETYSTVYSIITSEKFGAVVFEILEEILEKHIAGDLLQSVLQSINNNDNFLITLNEVWEKHQKALLLLNEIFEYLNHAYSIPNGKPEIYAVGLNIFRDRLVHYGCIRDHMRETLLSMVMCERKGEVIDHIVIKNTCKMLLVLGIGSRCVYEEIFERPFLAQSAAFYKMESHNFED